MKGFTLIELVVSIVVFSIIIFPLMRIFSTVSKDTSEGIFIDRASSLANSYMELVLTKSFDESKNPPWTDPGDLGPEAGESSISDYDDVDDFNNYNIKDSDYPNLSGTITVYYIVDNGDGTIDWNKTSDVATNYKRIDIRITNPELGQVLVTNGVTYAGHTTK